MQILSGTPGFTTPLEIEITFRNNGASTAKEAHFSFSYLMVDSFARETPIPIPTEDHGGDRDIAPQADFVNVISEIGSALRSETPPPSADLRRIQLLENGAVKIRLRARVDYIAGLNESGGPIMESASVCRDFNWKFNDWLTCEERTPGLPPIR